MSRTEQGISVHSRSCCSDTTIGRNGSEQRADIRPFRPAESLLKRAIRIVVRSMYLDLRHDKTGAVLNHLPSQARHEARDEQQHRIAERDSRHRDEGTPAIAPEIAPGEL